MLTALFAALLCTPASAQVPTLAPPFTSSYAVSVLQTPPGVPARLGGLTLKAGTTDRLLLGGEADSATGALYEVTVARSPQGHISGFVGTATRYADAAYNDGGIVYGPGNVLFLARWPNFGLAKDSQASNLTRPGQALGSLDYMSPEQIRGEEVSPATDIYALGCVVFECLTGTPPFGGRPSMRVLFAHLQEEPPDLTEGRKDVSPATARAITRAMDKEPEDRPSSAGEYVTGIARAAGIQL
jgi:protein kinase-like protein